MPIFSDMGSSSSAEGQDDFLLELFDWYWFQNTVFVGKTLALEQPTGTNSESKRLDESHDEELIKKSELARVNTLNVRSMSDRFVEVELGMTDSDSAASPKSVLATPKLQTILSGKEVTEFTAGDIVEETEKVPEREKGLVERRHTGRRRRRRRRKKKGNSKSLSELEVEELKGFMDLGFVFSEQDKDSVDLVSIIPGLQRLGEHQNCEAEEGEDIKVVDNISVPRPYLSEAWEILDRRKKVDPLMNWKVTDLGNEMAVKDQLRFWAHAVASTVR